MYENLGIDWLSPLQASAVFGIVVGLIFGAAAFYTKFCLRRALVDNEASTRSNALAVWATALAVALVGTQLSVLAGWIEFSDHRLHSESIPIALIAIGGILFGAGMVLTRGCASRLTVLSGSGNLRALFVIIIFAITAHATLKGVLSPLRTTLAELTVETAINTQFLESRMVVWTIVLAFVAVVFSLVRRSAAPRMHITVAVLIGLLVPAAWVGTGFVLQDDFDPIVFQSLSFTSPSSEWLFWSIASTSTGAGFGVGLLSGVVLGSAIIAIAKSEFQWQSFTSPSETGRYSLGAVLMGIGGVFAGGCTVGAGLSGVASLSISAFLSLTFIVIGAKVTHAALNASALAPKSLKVARI
ncbi:MAG: YeeE/YedE family protein [Granulosicoccus sp.]